MSGWSKLCNIVFWLALLIWAGALISAGVAAMNVFGTLDEMPLIIEQYAAYPSDEHSRLAAGRVMDGVFFLVDLLQFVAIPLAVLSLLLQHAFFRLPIRRPASIVRGVCVLAAAALFAVHATMYAPTMNRHLRDFWTAAEAGKLEEATRHRTAFNVYHPRAEGMLKLNLVLVLIGAAASAVVLSPDDRKAPAELQAPRLASRS